jgi:hypothetical protein
MKTRYVVILVIIATVCFAIFYYQFTYNVDTSILINETQVSENGTITGFLIDAHGKGVPNKTIYYHPAGNEKTSFSKVTTDKNGMFKIENVKGFPESGNNNYYGDISFNGEGQFNPSKSNQVIIVS